MEQLLAQPTSVPAAPAAPPPAVPAAPAAAPAPIPEMSSSSSSSISAALKNMNWVEVGFGVLGTAALFYTIYYYRYSTWKGKTIHLEDLVIKEKMRGTGLGYALYSEIIKQGKKDKVRRIEWNVLDWNTPAIEFYEKSGAKILDDWKVVQMSEEAINYFVDNKLK